MKDKKKIIIIVSIVLILIIFLCFFIKKYYKNQKVGNNMSNKNIEEIEEYILNISSYWAKMEITVESNKNTNQYVIEQTYQKGKISKQTVLEPSNIAGIQIIYEQGTLTINNTKLNLTSVYKNYEYLTQNCLWLDSFIQDYIANKPNNKTSITEENDIITMETMTQNQNNKYIYEKELYIDKKTGKPTKLLIKDINKKNLIYISYNEMTVNGLQ